MFIDFIKGLFSSIADNFHTLLEKLCITNFDLDKTCQDDHFETVVKNYEEDNIPEYTNEQLILDKEMVKYVINNNNDPELIQKICSNMRELQDKPLGESCAAEEAIELTNEIYNRQMAINVCTSIKSMSLFNKPGICNEMSIDESDWFVCGAILCASEESSIISDL